MPDYRRHKVSGGCYFFTVNLLERHGNRLLTQEIELLRQAVRRVRKARPFTIDAWVVLPDHLHALWTLPFGDDVFSTRWRLIRTFFCPGPAADRATVSRTARGRRTGHLAAPLFGTCHPRRCRLCGACRLCAF